MFYFFSGSYLSYILSCCNAFTCFHAVSDSLLFTHTCPVTEFAVASHLNTANSCYHHVFLRHFRFQKCLPVYSNLLTHFIPIFFMAVLTDEARKLSAFPAQAAIFDPLNIRYIYRNHGIYVPRSYFVHTSLKNLLHN